MLPFRLWLGNLNRLARFDMYPNAHPFVNLRQNRCIAARWLEVLDFRQNNRQTAISNSDRLITLDVNHRNRRTPIALAGN